MKQRFTSVDCAAEVACLNNRLLGLRLANVYDLNAKTYVLKLAKSGEDGEKVFLLLESGARFHTTELLREKADVPSNFTLKLRKHIRTRRLEAVRQLGVDRIVDFVFGSGEGTYHLILEMYSQGNIVLTDKNFEVLTLLRSHRDDEKGFAVMARHAYPMHAVRLRQQVQRQELWDALNAGMEQGQPLKGTLASLLPYGPAIAEHCIIDSGLDPGSKLSSLEMVTQALEALLPALGRLDTWFATLEQGGSPLGFITVAAPGSKKNPQQSKKKEKQQQNQPGSTCDAAGVPAPPGGESEVPEIYQDFNPLRLGQSAGHKVVEFPTFDAALDDFYSKIEGQRAAIARAEAEKNAMGKLDRIRTDQASRVTGLQREAEEAELRGTLIEYNLEAVDAVLLAVNEALASGMDWQELDRMIRDERKAGNPVACLIHSLQLDQNKVTLILSNYLDTQEDEFDEEANTRPASKVQVDLSLSAYSNVSVHYDSRKKHVVKQVKTLAANEAALKAAEKKAQQQLQQVRNQPSGPVAVRKPLWFEKFNWFISSENYLVISGRDAQQNELIVKRYFRRGDVYVHADLHGASSTIIKNPDQGKPVPPMTLQQAGCACVCRSRAWDSKIVTSAWWVQHHQVSKAAPTGEYLPTGSFMIRGRKNFLPPQPLVFGFGFMFKLEESSIAAHLGERAPRLLLEEEGSQVLDDEGDIEIEEEQDEEEVSALDRFMEGGIDPLARSASSTAGGLQATSSGLGSRTAAASAANKAQLYKRYGLSEEDAEVSIVGGDVEGGAEAGEGGANGQQQSGRRHMSAKERELMKKGGGQFPKQQQQVTASSKGGENQGKKLDEGVKGKSPLVLSATAAAAAARGKKGKQQKIKERYADQDDEDRELALAVLASQGDKKTRADRRKERKERKELKRQDGQTSVPGLNPSAREEAIAKATQKQFTGGAAAAAEEEPSSSDTAGSNRSSDAGDTVGRTEAGMRKRGEGDYRQPGDNEDDDVKAQQDAHPCSVDPEEEQGELHATDDAEKAEIAALLAEEKTAPELAEEERDRLTVLDALTGVPRAEEGDLLLTALPVCGPYQALQGFKYKVKLTPGTVKKGKASKQALELLIRGQDVAPREKELLRAIPEMDMINAMVGTVKISMPGMQKLKAVEKTNRKIKAKANVAAGI
ncbi:hypothetical protein CEUSTIGMA_g8028.t1 [Chlamydomonas eustigma]|uniref:NFACT RNA-binding domain-containing protein n=1 Tax=Chlamydomonas eustigma TaxID=1157962 RepID=A0A250XBY6_9CHLO|nr:hypothetical protein CEUSTIGMA_g8028.t1 [Chlamydomonas eustigma]|eukprot:GAX80591.1 hypothetical protein CEUSTIGMA_g8028.t1 [Chlamydomonas eustigma]